MDIQKLKSLLADHTKVKELQNGLSQTGNSIIQVDGMNGSLPAIVAAICSENTGAPQIFIAPGQEEAAYFLNDFSKLTPHSTVHFFPSSYKRSLKHHHTDKANLQLRSEVLRELHHQNDQFYLVTYPEAITEKVVTDTTLQQSTLTLKKGENISIDDIIEFMTELEFERVDFVYEPGQFSIRGSIIDIFSYSSEFPYRLDFFGDEIESMRSFDIESQLSKEKFDSITILPNIHSTDEEKQSFFHMLPAETVCWIKEPAVLKAQMDKIYEETTQLNSDIQPARHYENGDEIMFHLQGLKVVEYNSPFYFTANQTINFQTLPQPAFNKNFELLGNNLKENEEKGYWNIILTNNQKQIDRLTAIFQDIDQEVHFTPVLETLHEGFIDKDAKICCYTDHQIFERYYRPAVKKGFSKNESINLKEIANLHPGDYVVHADHGIGKFAGLQKVDINGKSQEAVKLIYKDNDSLFVSIHSLHKISKYKDKEGEQPKIYKLGSGAWQNLKQKAKRKIKDIAKELIDLYAKRKEQEGFAFSPDSYLQKELEASFIYEDTPDQDKATRQVKEAMEAQYPMDFLVCGDVGFGKTEIAIRAAFKAVADNKQVAVLVPTTILALQHYTTFTERLKDFPCTIDFLSRLKSQKAQKETMEKLQKGDLDIVIGTHRLVSKDIGFKDLGLLIIDEEQKFGVAVKEKLKKLKLNIDTLTLTATPIPRTLQFSLMGARDLSIIQTPPPNRHPIITEIQSFNETVIREAIYYETSRNGQIFFIHNWVHNIRAVEEYINKICPDVRTIVAHGQMKGEELEDIMLNFINGNYDVLVSTTIIESGLDIPNANTIIINNAHHFGISDLHQLRGRVGRSNTKAYCYLLAPPLSSLPESSRKRLKAVEGFSDLGSGFHIAMQDLDIRGAGNLLGSEQSGFIADIGFENYHRILNEALQELKENEYKDVFSREETSHQQDPSTEITTAESFVQDCQIDTDMELLFPASYISNASERIRLYRRLDNINEEEELQQFAHELTDRFGELPEPSKELFEVVRLRWLAMKLGFEKLILKNNQMIAHFISNQSSPYYQTKIFSNLLTTIQKNPNKYDLKEKNNKLSLSVSSVTNIQEAKQILTELLEDQQVPTAQ